MEEYITDANEMIGKGYDNFVKDEAPHDFYCQIPNMVDDYGLSPQAFRLYAHLRRVAGEAGKCWQNTKTLATACDMSGGAISAAKKELISTPFIPFIRVVKIPTKSGFSYDEITITDLWQLNHDIYQKEPVHNMNGSEYERLVHNVKQRISLIKKTPVNTGADAPLDWKLAHNIPITEEDLDQSDVKRKDVANLIATGLGVDAQAGYAIAYAFMKARNILIPQGSIKGQRKAVRELLDMHVQPAHIVQAVEKLMEANLTITDLYSVSRTAIDLANPKPVVTLAHPPEADETKRRLEEKERGKVFVPRPAGVEVEMRRLGEQKRVKGV